MVFRGNICSSGFYSDDCHVQGAEWGERELDLENKSFAKKKQQKKNQKYEFTTLFRVIFKMSLK